MISVTPWAQSFCFTKYGRTQLLAWAYCVLECILCLIDCCFVVLDRHRKWLPQFCWEQSCCGWWLWVLLLFLEATQALPSFGIAVWNPLWLCKDKEQREGHPAKRSLVQAHTVVYPGTNYFCLIVWYYWIHRWACGLSFPKASLW